MLRWLRRGLYRIRVSKYIIFVIVFIFCYVNINNIQYDTLSELCCSQEKAKADFTLQEGGEDEANRIKRSQNILNITKTMTKTTKSFGIPGVTNNIYKGVVNDWVEVDQSDRAMFLYSAYYDDRSGFPSVRIVSILKKKHTVRNCELWTKNGQKLTSAAIRKTIRENWALLYSASFIVCKGFKLEPGDRVTEVSVLTTKGPTKTKLKVDYFEDRKPEGDFSVCVKSFHYNYNRAVWLVEFIELHRILGVQKFFFYNHTVGPDVERVLQYYIKENIVEINPWTLPVKTQKEIRTEGIFAALNDCNLRNIRRFKHTLMIDLDEFIIPRQTNSYNELIKKAGADKSSYIFQNVFFYLYWNNDTSASNLLYGSPKGIGNKLYGNESNGPYLLTAYKTTRLSVPHKHNSRSKYIVKPEKVIECGNHYVWEYVGGKSSVNVNKDEALVHHYRICEYGGFDCLQKPHLKDTTAHKWLPDLFQNVAEVCSLVYPSKKVCPEAPPLGSPW